MSAPRWRSGEGLPRGLIAVVGVTLALRLAAGGLTHLTEDEAYYRLWSFSPAFGYFDHPPMIAWWIWLGRHLAGDSPLGARLLPILATAAIGLVVFDMTRLAGGTRSDAQRAGLFFNASLLVLGGGFLAVPDAPASLFLTLSLWSALRANRPGRAEGWWALAGLAAGLACLSKYSALFVAPGMVLWLAASPQGRRRLAGPGPWLAAAIAVAVFSPNIVWNAGHGWLTIAKQFARIAPRAFQPRYFFELIAGQVLLLNPLVAGCALAAGLGRRGRAQFDLRPFALVAAPFAAYLVVHSLHDRVQAHWPAPLYPMAAVCAAAGAARLTGRWRFMARAALPVGFAFGVLGLAILAAPGAWFGRFDPALPVRGWPAFTGKLADLARAHHAAWVGTTSYGLAADLADHPGLPVIQLAERERWRGLGQPRADVFRSPGLVVDLTRRLEGAHLADCFATATPLVDLARGDPGEPGKAYAVFLVAGPRLDLLADGCPGL